jgi:hypothetical protein
MFLSCVHSFCQRARSTLRAFPRTVVATSTIQAGSNWSTSYCIVQRDKSEGMQEAGVLIGRCKKGLEGPHQRGEKGFCIF